MAMSSAPAFHASLHISGDIVPFGVAAANGNYAWGQRGNGEEDEEEDENEDQVTERRFGRVAKRPEPGDAH